MTIAIFVLFMIAIFTLIVFMGSGTPRDIHELFHGNYYAEDAVTSEDDAPNSKQAIEKCIENGVGIKTELFITKDRQVVVSAANDLSKQYGIDKKISECDFDEINNAVMSLKEFIDLVDGKVPVILELKTGINNELLCRYTADAIKASGHKNIGVASFHSGMMAWFKEKEKRIFRGLISAPSSDFKALSKLDRFMTANMANNSVCRPRFALYRNRPQPALAKLAFKLGVIEGVWTVTDKAEGKAMESNKSMIVCRGFMPDAPHYQDLPELQKSAYQLKDEAKRAEKEARLKAKEELKNSK